jgi:anti-sigma factor RsiW
MSCEKYSGWLTDAALGELRAEREPELLAHASECDSCREALSHAREVGEFVDRGVEALVAGEPSPHFATNLRRRIAQETESLQSPWMAWAPIIAAALAITAVLAIMVAHSHVRSLPNPSLASAGAPISALHEAATASPTSPQLARRTEGKHAPEPSTQARPRTTALPEIIVPKGQLSAAAQLSAAINSGRVDGNQLLAAQQEYQKPLEVQPVEIAPLEIPALDDATEKPANSIRF